MICCFPCGKYERIDEFDSFVTHCNMLKDLEKVEKIGPAAYQKEQKEKAAFVTKRFQDMAEQKKIILKLRRKPGKSNK